MVHKVGNWNKSKRYLEQEMPEVYEAFYALNTFSIKAWGEVRKERANILALCERIPNFMWGFKFNMMPYLLVNN